MKTLMITFVYNELKYLPHTIEYYKKNGCDVYIIDNYSKDGTYEWLVENNIPCHRLDTNESFHVQLLEADLMRTVHRIKPDWVIFGSADLYHVTEIPISEYIEKVDSLGFNQLRLPCISAINVDEIYNLPMPKHQNYGLYYKPLTMISKYNENLYLGGDDFFVNNAKPFTSDEGVSINYGPCKPNKDQDVKLERTRKAHANGMHPLLSVHYEKGKKLDWKFPKNIFGDKIFELKDSKYWNYILKIREID